MMRRIALFSLFPFLFLVGPRNMDETGRTGLFITVFKENHPESALATISARTGCTMEAWDSPTYNYVLQNATYVAYVPPDYRPDTTYGLFVWISPGESGAIPRSWIPVMDKHRMIWIAADISGNTQSVYGRRIPLALDAVHNMTRLYAIDLQRITVAGFSGGGRTASIAALNYPDIFPRGLFIAGVNFWEEIASPSEETLAWPAGMAKPLPRNLTLIKEKSRLVLMTGDEDFNREQTQTYHKIWFKKNPFRSLYLQVPGMKHELPPAEALDKALLFLDEKPTGP